MRTFAEKQKIFQRTNSAKSIRSDKKRFGQSRGVHSTLHPQRTTIGNQALLQLLAADVENKSTDAAYKDISRVSHDPTRAPACRPDGSTGIPNPLKAGLEALSGVDLSDIQVHRNSPKPAELNALAYAQGQEIHLGPGQEKHLPHEAWHTVQQMKGQVMPTIQEMGVSISDIPHLEIEADVMGAKALQGGQLTVNSGTTDVPAPISQAQSTQPIQRVAPAPAAAAGLWGVAGLEAVEAATLGLTAIPLVQAAGSKSDNIVYVAETVSRLMDKEPKPFSRKYVHWIFQANAEKFIADPAGALFELVVDSNDYGEVVAYVRKNMQHTDSFSKSSFTATFKSLGLYPREGGEKDPRAWPIRYSYEGTYDPWGGGEFDFQGEFIFNAFGMFRILEHRVVDRSVIECSDPNLVVFRFSDRSQYTIPELPEPQRRILMRNYKNDPNYRPSR